jgi:hypothetical protein
MFDPHQHDSAAETADVWVRNTLLVRRWENMKHEILLHKWYESEKAGHDIGWERAAVDWMIRFGCRQCRRPAAE